MARRFLEQKPRPDWESAEPTRALTRREKAALAVGTLLSMAGFILAVMLTLAFGGFLLVFKGLFALILIGLPVFFVSLIVKRLQVLLSLVFGLFHSMVFGLGGAFGVVVLGYGLFGRLEMLFMVIPGFFLAMGSCFFAVHVLSIPGILRKALSGASEQAPRDKTLAERQLEALNDIQVKRDQETLLRKNDRGS